MDHDVILDEPLIVEELEHLGKSREDGLGGHAHQVGVLLAEHGSRLFQSADKNECEEKKAHFAMSKSTCNAGS